jgi:flavodoxin
LKKIYFVAVASSLLLLLTGCTENRDESQRSIDRNSNTSTNNTEQSSSELGIVGTDQYGRGAKSDGQDTNRDEAPMRNLTEDADSIIIYFSRSGNTENLAKIVQSQTNADILELTISNPYPEDYKKSVDRANQERDNEEYPKIITDIPDLSQYDHVYLGYQTWAMTLSNPISSFLINYGELLDGKEIYPFSSNAGYGEGNSIERIQELLPNSTIKESFSIQDEEVISSQDEIAEWLGQ